MDKRILLGCFVIIMLFPVSFVGAKQLSEQDGMIPVEQWNKTFGGTGWESAESLIETADGGYLLAGFTVPPGDFEDVAADMWLVKTDSNGNEQWNKTFGGILEDAAVTVIETAAGGYLAAGWTESSGAGDRDMWLVKTDSSGNEQWNKTFGGTRSDHTYSVIETAAGGYLAAGDTKSSGTGYDYMWLVKTDSSGNEQWNKTFGGTGVDINVAYSVIETATGGYLLAGDTSSYGAGLTDFWLVKTDNNGQTEWSTTFGGTGWEEAKAVIETAAGGYLLAGSTDSFGAGDRDMWLVKTDSNGNEQWNKTFGGIFEDWASTVIESAAGGYLLAGFTSFGALNKDVWLVKTDSNGNEQWNTTFGGPDVDIAYSVIETAGDGYLLAGSTKSFGAGGTDAWLVKIGTPTNGQTSTSTSTNGQVPSFLFIPLISAIIILSRRRKPRME
ncbi:MAG: hypothetical protein ACFFD4_26575 [Candidatus Odinarchaeota archaeon]